MVVWPLNIDEKNYIYQCLNNFFESIQYDEDIETVFIHVTDGNMFDFVNKDFVVNLICHDKNKFDVSNFKYLKGIQGHFSFEGIDGRVNNTMIYLSTWDNDEKTIQSDIFLKFLQKSFLIAERNKSNKYYQMWLELIKDDELTDKEKIYCIDFTDCKFLDKEEEKKLIQIDEDNEKRSMIIMKEITFEQTLYHLNDKIKLDFVYKGFAKNEIAESNIALIKKMVDQYLSNCIDTGMEKRITYLKTILKDFEEKDMTLTFEEPGVIERVEYQDGKFSNYHVECKKYDFTYDNIAGLKINFKNIPSEVFDENPSYYSELMDEVETKIYKVKNAEILTFICDPKRLINFYEYFYGELPDFKDSRDAHIKFNSMCSILNYFKIKLSDNYNIVINPSNNSELDGMPVSWNLISDIKQLIPFGVIPFKENTLGEELKNVVTQIGKLVRESVPENTSLNEYLIGISRGMFISSYDLDNDIDILENKEIENCRKLAQKYNESK